MNVNKFKGQKVFNVIKLCPPGKLRYYFTCESKELVNPDGEQVSKTFLQERYIEVPKSDIMNHIFDLNEF